MLEAICSSTGCKKVLKEGTFRIEQVIEQQVTQRKQARWVSVTLLFCPDPKCFTSPKDHVLPRQIPSLTPHSSILVDPTSNLTIAEKELLVNNGLNLVII